MVWKRHFYVADGKILITNKSGYNNFTALFFGLVLMTKDKVWNIDDIGLKIVNILR